MSYVASHDHLLRGLQKLLGQFRDSPKIRALLATYLRQIQALEDFANQAMAVLSINNGYGIVLDRIGKLIGRGRMGLSDGDYKYALRAQIRINRSCGIHEDFIQVIALSLDNNPAFSTELRDTGLNSRAAEVIIHGALPATVIQVLWYSIQQIREAGVHLEFVYSLYDDSHTFAFAPTLTAPTAHGPSSATQGFGWAAAPTGGHFVGELATP